MINKLPKLEASTRLLGRKYKAEVWSAIIAHNVEPPEAFYASSLHRQLIRETDSSLAPRDVSQEIDDFETAGMIERVDAPAESDLPANTKVYKCVGSSPGWLMVSGAVEAFNAWYAT